LPVGGAGFYGIGTGDIRDFSNPDQASGSKDAV
jgi:hypothetical protein